MIVLLLSPSPGAGRSRIGELLRSGWSPIDPVPAVRPDTTLLAGSRVGLANRAQPRAAADRGPRLFGNHLVLCKIVAETSERVAAVLENPASAGIHASPSELTVTADSQLCEQDQPLLRTLYNSEPGRTLYSTQVNAEVHTGGRSCKAIRRSR